MIDNHRINNLLIEKYFNGPVAQDCHAMMVYSLCTKYNIISFLISRNMRFIYYSAKPRQAKQSILMSEVIK